MDSEIRSLFIDSLNKLIDLHQSRMTVAMQYRIPGTVWLVVYLLSVMSMLTLGYYVGNSGVRRLRGTPLLSAAFSIVILMIAGYIGKSNVFAAALADFAEAYGDRTDVDNATLVEADQLGRVEAVRNDES